MKEEEKQENNERWLLTYSDLITLLMIFFVILYASSNVDSAKYKALSESFQIALNGQASSVVDGGESGQPAPIAPSSGAGANAGAGNKQMTEEQKLLEVKQKIDKYIKENGLSGMSTSVEKRGVVVTLSNTILFDSGKIEIKESVKNQIMSISKSLNSLGNYVRVEGHTDNVPIHNERFESNWELSALRATRVAKVLIDGGMDQNKIAAVGYGETRPMGDNSKEEGKAKNRRVEIVLLSSKFDNGENKKNK